MISSSPPSSPSPCVNSSPPSSPAVDPLILDDYDPEGDPSPTFLVDPFAASVKAYWPLPDYERRFPGNPKKGKRVRAEPISPGSFKRPKYHYRPTEGSGLNFNQGQSINDGTGCDPSREQHEASIWEEACTRVFNGNGNIDLSNHNLTRIPRKFIEDLGKIYIPPDSFDRFQLTAASQQNAARPFLRSVTAPADMGTHKMARTNIGRVWTVSDASLGLPKGQIALFLMHNQITSLPKELFALEKLTVLSLRNNKLTHLPPEIKCLTNLHTLNVAYNKIRYLPCEMLQMSLEKLSVHPNPFLEPPTSNGSSMTRSFSQPVYILPRVIPLVELCLRRLLSQTSNETFLATYYELPLPEWFHRALPEKLRMAIDACAPGSFYRLTTERSDDGEGNLITGLGHCPCSEHGAFVQHAEERFTWEYKVANVEFGERIPIKWRGCNWGCLTFLEDRDEKQTDSEDAVRVLNLGSLGFDNFT